MKSPNINRRGLVLQAEGNSMLPLIRPNDCLFLEKCSFAQIKSNDIVTFRQPDGLVTHRVIYKNRSYLVTKGDNNYEADGKIKPQAIVGKMTCLVRGQKEISLTDHFYRQSALYFRALGRLNRELAKGGVRFLFLKGLPVHQYYFRWVPERVYLDADLLIHPKDFIRTEAILKRLGYREIHTPLDAGLAKLKHYAPEKLFGKEINGWPVSLDIHIEPVFMMTELGVLNELYPLSKRFGLGSEFIECRRWVKSAGVGYPVLSPLHLVLYLALHLFHHNYRGAYRYTLLDQVVRREIRRAEWSWDDFSGLLSKYRLEKFVVPALWLLKHYYRTPVPSKILSGSMWRPFAKTDIFSEQERIPAGVERFWLLFKLSPEPWLGRLRLVFNPVVLYVSRVVLYRYLTQASRLVRQGVERLIAIIAIVLLIPLWGLLFVLVKLDSNGPFIFTQRRAGKHKEPFTIYKIRTMVVDAEELKETVLHLNEADGPVFKIKNDPRFTRVGKIISRLALDELPQLWNIAKGEMAFVGPRPLPLPEAEAVPPAYSARFRVLPGLTSSWIANGYRHDNFREWMEADIYYARRHSLAGDLLIFWQTIWRMAGSIWKGDWRGKKR